MVAGNVAKYEAAAAGIASPRRDVLRVRGYFATVYAVGCLAVRFKIFPFTEAEVLEALLTCHRDHVAFIDEQLSIPAGSRPAIIHGATATTTREPIAGTVVPAPTPFDRLRRFINRNSRNGRRGFIDLRSPGLSRLGFKLRVQRLKGPVLGYIADGEYWIPGDPFEEVAKGSREALALKQEVDRRGLLETTRRGPPASATSSSVLCRTEVARTSWSSGTTRRGHRGRVPRSRRLRPRRSPPKHDQ